MNIQKPLAIGETFSQNKDGMTTCQTPSSLNGITGKLQACVQLSLKIIICLLLFYSSLPAQEFSGYVSAMPSLITQQPVNDTWWQMLVHKRLNFNWQMTEHLRIDAGIRNRLITGSEAMLDSKSTSADMGWIDMSWNSYEGKRALINISLDRLYVTFEKDKWKLQTGRQRINWGQTFVWNPNDIFNTYSFFDFDYPERSGCDAFRGTYYHNETSSSELAVSVNHDKKITAALLHRWNNNNIDYQFIIGEQSEIDLVIGAALTKDFSGLNLRSEISYFHPYLTDKNKIVAISVGADYIFSNSLMLQSEILYSNVGKTFLGSGLMDLYDAPLSAKYLSICDWNIFANVSYPITPRLNGSLSVMYFVGIHAYYTGLSFDYSVIENLDFSLIAQYFFTSQNKMLIGSPGPQSNDMVIILGFARLKYSF